MVRYLNLDSSRLQARWYPLGCKARLCEIEDGNRIVTFHPISGHPYSSNIFIDGAMNIDSTETYQMVSLRTAMQVALVGCSFKPFPKATCMWWRVGTFEYIFVSLL